MESGIDLSNKTYVVTGATSGIGLATAQALVRAGADVIGVGRSPERCRQAEARLRGLARGNQVDYLLANLSVQEEVVNLAVRITDLQFSTGKNSLDGLVNNAGVFTYWFTQTPDGIEMQWAVNHLAPFMLTQRLLPLLEQAPFARVVTVSSDSHFNTQINWADPQLRRQYNGLRAYGTTKLANILFTLELNNRLGITSSVHAFAVDPGLVNTDIGMKGTPPLASWVWSLRRKGGTSPEVPAQGILYLLSQPDIQNSEALYWKNSQPKRSSRVSVDRHSARKLWTLSAQMCGLS
jgi:NAD(P)-dependent dehydrogenase (short-subunit alcohol dehydrogenase family)